LSGPSALFYAGLKADRIDMEDATTGPDNTVSVVDSPLNVLVVHDDSVMSDMLINTLGDQHLLVEAVGVDSVDDVTLRLRCIDSDAVLCVSTGWDPQTAEREGRQLDVVIAALAGSGKRLVYLSESTVIGDTGAGFGNEDSPRSIHAPHPWRVVAEQKVEAAVSVGVRSIIVRPALVHGRGAGALLQRLVGRAASSGESVYVDDGTARVSTIHVDDVITLVRHALIKAPQGAIYAAASGEALSWRDLANAVARTNSGHCEVESITQEDAARAGLDAVTMTMSNVVRDRSAYRRFGWQPTGQTLVADAMTSAR
jgi:nucleoside-diphosphate-sugar epimerase